MIAEIKRVIKPGVTLVLITPNFRKLKNILILIFNGVFPKTSGDPIGWDGGHLHYFTYRDIKYILTKCGFKTLLLEGLLSTERFFILKKYLRYFFHDIFLMNLLLVVL